MATSHAPQIRSIYRRLLRELPASTSAQAARTAHQKLSAPSHIQKRIRASISQQRHDNHNSNSQAQNSQDGKTQAQLAHAEQFVQYLQAQRMYASLVERYNPGMGMSEEERVRLSARRVGMNLPVEFEKGGVGGEGKE